MGLGVAITFLGTCTHVILRHVDATLSYRWGGVGWGGAGGSRTFLGTCIHVMLHKVPCGLHSRNVFCRRCSTLRHGVWGSTSTC